MNGKKIKVIGGKAAHRCLDGGADVKKFHVKKDALAMFGLQLIGQRQTAAGQHAKTDLVEADSIAQRFRKLQPRQGIGHIQRHDKSVIGFGHNGSLWLAGSWGAGPGLSSSLE